MDKKLSFILLLTLTLFFSTLPAYAAKKEEKFKPTLSVSGEVHHLSMANSRVEGVEIAFDAATAPHLSINYRPLQYLAIELGAWSAEMDIDVGIDERFEHYGTFSQSTYSLTMLYMTQTKKNSPFKLFMGAGLSYHVNEIEREKQSAAIEDFFAKNRTISNIDNSIGGHGTIGFKYMFSDNLLIKASLTLSATSMKTEVTYPDNSVRESDMAVNAISIGTGLVYEF